MSTRRTLPAGTVTMLFTDIEGSTRLLKQLGERYGEVLAGQRRILREAVTARGGWEMDNQGDAFFFAFARAGDAVDAAVAAQRGLAAHEWPDGLECRVRMGLHTGEPSVGEEGYHGIGLTRGARIAATARGGQVLLSTTTAELIHDDLPAGVSIRDLGTRLLKDIDRPERVYEVVADGLPKPLPPPAPVRSRRRLGAVLAAGTVVAVLAVVIVLLTGGSGSPTASGAPVSADSVGIFNPSSGRLIGQIAVGASPSAVIDCSGSIWVTNVDAHSVSRVDPAKQVVIQTLQVGNGPDGIACGRGAVWVTNGLDGTVSEINTESDTVVDAAIPVGNQPAGLAVGGRYVWVANAADGSVSRIVPATGRVLPPIPVDGGANGVAVGDGSVWITGRVTGSVTRIDERTASVLSPINAGGGVDAVAFGAGSVWAANYLDGTVTRIDPATNTVAATIPVGDGPNGLAAGGRTVWASNELAGTLTSIDPRTNIPGRPVPTGNRPEGLALDSGALFVAVRASGVGHTGGTLRVLASRQGLVHPDPALAYNLAEGQIAVLTNDGLVGYRRSGGSDGDQLVPDLAVSLPTPTDGGRSYNFQLRPGIRYSTGARVRPEDIRRGIERSFELSTPYAAYYAHIVGAGKCIENPKAPCDLSKGIVSDPGANTIAFRLTSPDPDFLYELALPSADAVPPGAPRPRCGRTVVAGRACASRGFVPATGPYEIAAFDPKSGIRLIRNPRFREWSPAAQPAGFPDAIVERFTGTPDQHVSAVLRGSAGLAADAIPPSPPVLAALRTQHPGDLEINPWRLTNFLFFGTRVPPFDDLRARRALNFALDRGRLRDLAQGPGLGRPTCQVLPPDFTGYRPYCPYTSAPSGAGDWTAPDLARARQLVRASGTAGQTVVLWMAKPVFAGKPAARYVVSVLDSLGYKASFRIGADPYSTEDKLRVQLGFSGWYPDFAAPSGFFDPILTCGSYNRDNSLNLNWSEFCDPAIDREIARAHNLQTRDPDAASREWAKVDHDVTDQAPLAPYANGVVLEVKSPNVGNYQFNPQWGTLLDQLWVR